MSNFAVSQISQSAVKSLQRGQASLPLNAATLTVNIVSVNMAKTIVRITGYVDVTSGSASMPFAYLQSPTQMVIIRQPPATSPAVLCSYEVVEFN